MLQIHATLVDSLTVRAYPKNKKKYEKFIGEFREKAFKNGRYGKVDFIGKKFDCSFDISEKDKRPIKLRRDGELTLGFTTKVPFQKSSIIIKPHQVSCWQGALQFLRKVKRDLTPFTGPLHLQVETIDISLHFSGLKIDDSFYDSIQAKTDNFKCHKKNKVITGINIGSGESGTTPYMRLYNKSYFLKKFNKTAASPYSIYSRPLPYGRDAWNLEFSFGVNLLKYGFALTEPSEVFASIPQLWNWAMTEFVYVSKEGQVDTIRPEWEEMRRAIGGLSNNYFSRKTRRKGDPNIELRKAQFLQKAKSLAEALGLESTDLLPEKLDELIAKKKK